jgi:Spy/CpxP family protein refolding chaperone
MPTALLAPAVTSLVLLIASGLASAQHAGHRHHPGHSPQAPSASPYAGQESRAIKSLSADDVQELSRGGGWGLARAAELNGIPGPLHLLELQREIELDDAQARAIRELYDGMRAAAIPLGRQLIEQERALDRYFQAGRLSDERLRELLERIGKTRTELRFVHLQAHHRTVEIVTAAQIATYNRLRGYAPADSSSGSAGHSSTDAAPVDRCANVPAGHDPVMYRRHMGCN